MWAFILKYWKYLILCIPIIALVIWVILLQVKLKEKDSIIYYKDSLIVVGENKWKSLAEEYINQTQINADLRKNNAELGDLLEKEKVTAVQYQQLYFKLKNQTFVHVDTTVVFNTVHDTLQVPVGQDVVPFDEQNSIVHVYGKTQLYPKKGYTLTIDGKEFQVDVVIAEDANGVKFAYVDTKNPDLELMKVNTRFLKEEDVSFTSKLYGITSVNFGSKKGFLDLGVGYKKWGLKGYIGYDDYNFKKENQFYGLGIMYKLF